MRTPTIVCLTTLAGAVLLAAPFPARAGDLNPPPGAIQSTNRITINQQAITALPFNITQPGSYVLISNLTGVSGQHGITINAENVTLDLNGFTLAGVSGSMTGIRVSTPHDNLIVRNGVISGWGGPGLQAAGATGVRVQGVIAHANANQGIWVGDNSIVADCRAAQNGMAGFQIGDGGTARNCVAVSNSGPGFTCLNSLIVNCVADGNSTSGILVLDASTITHCVAVRNGGYGINATSSVTVTDCTASSNGGGGIDLALGCVASGCTARNNTLEGIHAGAACVVVDCSAESNGDVGIFAGTGSTVKSCVAKENTSDGIKVTLSCNVLYNQCYRNGFQTGDGAGIHVAGSATDNRIEGNNVIDNDRGIDVDAAGNLIIKNSASGNTTNYAITGTQTIGPIITATGTITSKNPWANFEF